MAKLTRSQKKVLADLEGRNNGIAIVRGISRRTKLRPGTVGQALAVLARRRLARRLQGSNVWEITERGELILEEILNE